MQRGRGGPAAHTGSFRPRVSSQVRAPHDSGSTQEVEVPGLAGGCRKHPGGGGRMVSKGKWGFTGCWEQGASVHTLVPVWPRGEGWMRLRPRDGRASGDRRSVPRNQVGWGRMLEPGLGSPAPLRTVGAWGLRRSKWHLSSLF